MEKAHFIPPTSPKRRYRHGHKPAGGTTREYTIWRNMRSRCVNPSDPNYVKYGARGIHICDEWRMDFVNFLRDMGRCPDGCSIERIDNDGHYEPGNCRWATAKEQANNRRSSRYITHDGETLTLSQWADRAGIRLQTLHFRLKLGWTVERALTTPLRRKAA